MSLFSFFKNPSEETVIIFDVGSASVGGAIVELEYGKKPSVSFTKRLEIPMI